MKKIDNIQKVIHSLLGWNSSHGEKINWNSLSRCRTVKPETTLPFKTWMKKYKVSSQFTFMDKNHYTETLLNTTA